MKRRDFSLSAASAVAVSALGLPLVAQAQAFTAGKDYLQLKTPVPTDAPQGKVEVIEFFWYSCGHCNAFEPQLEEWIKNAPARLAIRRIPVAFRPNFEAQQKLYFALEAMGRVPDLHSNVFRAIHVERNKLDTEDLIFAWAAKQPKLDAKQFAETFKSFGVANKVRRAKELQEAYGVEAVPSMGIAGRYYTDGSLARGMPNVLRIVEQLAASAPAA